MGERSVEEKSRPPPNLSIATRNHRVWLHVLNELPRPFFSKWMKQPLLFPFGDGLRLFHAIEIPLWNFFPLFLLDDGVPRVWLGQWRCY